MTQVDVLYTVVVVVLVLYDVINVPIEFLTNVEKVVLYIVVVSLPVSNIVVVVLVL